MSTRTLPGSLATPPPVPKKRKLDRVCSSCHKATLPHAAGLMLCAHSGKTICVSCSVQCDDRQAGSRCQNIYSVEYMQNDLHACDFVVKLSTGELDKCGWYCARHIDICCFCSIPRCAAHQIDWEECDTCGGGCCPACYEECTVCGTPYCTNCEDNHNTDADSLDFVCSSPCHEKYEEE